MSALLSTRQLDFLQRQAGEHQPLRPFLILRAIRMVSERLGILVAERQYNGPLKQNLSLTCEPGPFHQRRR